MRTGHIAHLAGRDGLVSGWLWLCWSPNGAARLAMGPKPDRGSAAEAFSFGAQMAGKRHIAVSSCQSSCDGGC